jgi:hypothetical protein
MPAGAHVSGRAFLVLRGGQAMKRNGNYQAQLQTYSIISSDTMSGMGTNPRTIDRAFR